MCFHLCLQSNLEIENQIDINMFIKITPTNIQMEKDLKTFAIYSLVFYVTNL